MEFTPLVVSAPSVQLGLMALAMADALPVQLEHTQMLLVPGLSVSVLDVVLESSQLLSEQQLLSLALAVSLEPILQQ